MAKMFKKGALITTMKGLLECRTSGTPWVFYKGRPLAISFVLNMSLMTVLGGLAAHNFRRAIRREGASNRATNATGAAPAPRVA